MGKDSHRRSRELIKETVFWSAFPGETASLLCRPRYSLRRRN